jgi:hypothetical protein
LWQCRFGKEESYALMAFKAVGTGNLAVISPRLRFSYNQHIVLIDLKKMRWAEYHTINLNVKTKGKGYRV